MGFFHPVPLTAEGDVTVSIISGASTALDLCAESAAPSHAFQRAAWFGGSQDRAMTTLVARRPPDGKVLAAIPVERRRSGPVRIAQLSGPYWPHRSFPVAEDAKVEDLVHLLSDPGARTALGRVWRAGPLLADDPSTLLLAEAADRSGWTRICRSLGTTYRVDLEALTRSAWPSTKTLRKNRWLERKLAAAGPIDFRSCSGSQWTDELFGQLASIESRSWVGREAASRDTKFLCETSMSHWRRAAGDPEIAKRLICSLLLVAGEPAAFTFMLRSGDRLHIIANSYDARFAVGSPGRVLLYRDLREAAQSGVRIVEWGQGDPGYKTEMGAEPGPELVDWLIFRDPSLAAFAGSFWTTPRR